MDKFDSDLVNLLKTQVDDSEVTAIRLLQEREDSRMLQPDVVDRIHALSRRGFGRKRIARELGISRNSVRRYLAGAKVGFQERPSARQLDAVTLREVRNLFNTVAEGNTVVVQQELTRRGIQVDLRTLQRAVAPLRQERRALALATVRFETPPGQQIQIDFGEKFVQIAERRVKVYFMTAVLGYSRRLYCRAFLAQRQDDWLEGLDGAFQHFGGFTEQILCDNASPLVRFHDRESGRVTWNPGFEMFCKDRGLTPKACRPFPAGVRAIDWRGPGVSPRIPGVAPRASFLRPFRPPECGRAGGVVPGLHPGLYSRGLSGRPRVSDRSAWSRGSPRASFPRSFRPPDSGRSIGVVPGLHLGFPGLHPGLHSCGHSGRRSAGGRVA